jgi:hypothetical protein
LSIDLLKSRDIEGDGSQNLFPSTNYTTMHNNALSLEVSNNISNPSYEDMRK